MISGMLFSEKKSSSKFIETTINKMVIPFIIYQIVDMLFTILKYLISNYQNIKIIEILKIIAKVTFINGSANSNGPLWFLPSLIYVELIFYLVCKLDKKWILYLSAIFMLIVGCLIKSKLIFRFGQIPSSYVLFTVGFISRDFIKKIYKNKYIYLICPLSVILFLVTNYINGFAELAARNFGNYYILYFIEVYFAFVFLISFSMIINTNRVLEYYGRNSMSVMCCHFIFVKYFVCTIFQIVGYGTLLENYFVEVVLSLLTMVVMYPVCEIINRYIPILSGKNDFKIKEK
jgi:fucose 4-O-acetylase-like acetyltransferase